MSFERLKSWFGTLRFHLFIWNTAVVLLIVLPTLLIVREYFRRTLYADFDKALEAEATEVVRSLETSFRDSGPQLFADLESRSRGYSRRRQWFAQVFTIDGTPLFATQKAPALNAPLPGDEADEFLEKGTLRFLQKRLVLPDQSRVVLRMGLSLQELYDDLGLLYRMVLVTGALIVVLAPLGGYWLANRATRPMAQIIHTATHLRPSKLDERLPLRGTGDEVDRLSETINGLLDRIAAYLEHRHDFLANAAHELRSPLAAIRAAAEVALDKPRSSEEYAHLLGDIMEECGGLETLVNQLLLLAEGDAGSLGKVRQRVSFDQIVRKSLSMFEGVAEAQDIKLLPAVTGDVEVMGDEGHLRQVINNLIDNALKFTPAGGTVSVALEVDAIHREAILRVEDSGVGIPAEDLPRIFERFYKGDKARPRQHRRGTGLGLSICHAILAAHEGRITVESRPEKGSTFLVYLPLASAERAAALVGG